MRGFSSIVVYYNKNPSCRKDSDRTALQHLWGSRDVIGHVTIWYPICRFLLVVLWNQASIRNGFRDF